MYLDCGLTQVAGAPLLSGVHPLNHSGALLGHLSLSLSSAGPGPGASRAGSTGGRGLVARGVDIWIYLHCVDIWIYLHCLNIYTELLSRAAEAQSTVQLSTSAGKQTHAHATLSPAVLDTRYLISAACECEYK